MFLTYAEDARPTPAPMPRGWSGLHIWRLLLIACCGLSLLLDPPAAEAAKKKKRSSSRRAKAEVEQPQRRSSSEAGEPASYASWERSVVRGEENYGEHWTARIEDLQTGEEIYSYNPALGLAPASNRKFVVMAMALQTLGPGYHFTTEFGVDQPSQLGRAQYHGNLILRSQGDPSLGFPFQDGGVNPATLFRGWARDLSATGVGYVQGDLLIDASAFGSNQNHYPEVWAESHRNQSYAPVASALAVCQNLLRVDIRGGSRGVAFYPGGEGISVVNLARGGGSGVEAKFDPDSGDLLIKGRSSGGTESVMVPLPRPLDYVGALMREALRDEGIQLQGKVRVLTTTRPVGIGAQLPRVIGSHQSPDLGRLLAIMTRNSNNFLAEQIWRTTTWRASGKAGLEAAREAEQDWYRRRGMPWIEPGWDGCGLSQKTRVSAEDLTAIARMIYQTAHREYIMEALPSSGQTGTLKGRNFGKAEGRVHAKTGTMNDVSALTGYIDDIDGTPRYVFSVIGNGRGDCNSRLSARITQLVSIALRNLDAGMRNVAANQ